MKLISMTDYVLKSKRFKEDSDTAIFKVTNYANFLKQPLNLGMFVSCDEDGNVLEEPIYSEPTSENEIGDLDEVVYQYNLAKDSVLFEGFEWDNREFTQNKQLQRFDEESIENKTIEDLAKYNLTLTKSAIETLGL